MQPDFFDNKMKVVEDELVERIDQGDRVSVAAFGSFRCTRIRSFASSSKASKNSVSSFTLQAFTAMSARPRKKREFSHPAPCSLKQGLCGTEFEIKLRTNYTQSSRCRRVRGVDPSADPHFKSYEGEGNATGFLDISKPDDDVAYMPFKRVLYRQARLGMGSAWAT